MHTLAFLPEIKTPYPTSDGAPTSVANQPLHHRDWSPCQIPRTRGSDGLPSIRLVSAQTSASSRSGEPPPDRPSGPKSLSLANFAKSEQKQNDEFCNQRSNSDADLDLAEGVYKTDLAALWLSQHRDELGEPLIPRVRERFGLTVLEAVDALQRGHALRYGGDRG